MRNTHLQLANTLWKLIIWALQKIEDQYVLTRPGKITTSSLDKITNSTATKATATAITLRLILIGWSKGKDEILVDFLLRSWPFFICISYRTDHEYWASFGIRLLYAIIWSVIYDRYNRNTRVMISQNRLLPIADGIFHFRVRMAKIDIHLPI